MLREHLFLPKADHESIALLWRLSVSLEAHNYPPIANPNGDFRPITLVPQIGYIPPAGHQIKSPTRDGALLFSVRVQFFPQGQAPQYREIRILQENFTQHLQVQAPFLE